MNTLYNCAIENADDFTFYYRCERDEKAASSDEGSDESEPAGGRHESDAYATPDDPIIQCALDNRIRMADDHKKASYDFTAALVDGQNNRIDSARLLAARCGGGEWWSITARSQGSKRTFSTPVHPPVRRAAAQGYAPKPTRKPDTVFSIAETVSPLYPLLFPERGSAPTGALFIMGETGSGKSQIARALIARRMTTLTQMYLKSRASYEAHLAGRAPKQDPPRRPHLVTLEDPIEVRFQEDQKLYPPAFIAGRQKSTLSVGPFDYTAREYMKDYTKLRNGLNDALRQKPSVVYVGEVRTDADISEVMSFAGTGHLVVTTAHAGSLTEGLDRILTSLKARLPAERAWIAQRLFALVHSRQILVDETRGALVPAVWRQRGSGRHAFVSDGLSAVHPGNPRGMPDDVSSFGRYWYANRLLAQFSVDAPRDRQQLLTKARELDLGGQ